MTELEQKLFEHIIYIYGEDQVEEIFKKINKLVEDFRNNHPDLANPSMADRVSESDSILITYGDMVRQEGQPPLQTLALFLQKYIGDVISTVHILPFYPYSSDDGFSIIDYKSVNSEFGDWEDIAQIKDSFRLMLDAVVNHVSSQSAWFQGFLRGEPDFEDYFTVVEDGTDLSRVFRPRATPVVTPFETINGTKLVWTTFSADQIDLNFANPQVLIEVIEILLFYVAHGAEFIRLDAVTFVWKEIGTSCINSSHTHRIVQTIRTVLDLAAPKVAVITETNVPHKDNIAYFGDGNNEAQMVYNFALPSLTLNAFHTEDVRIITKWARTLDLPSNQATFFNFLACHDGVGLLPVKNILNLDAINEFVDRTHKLGGFVSYKNNEDGSQSPYELNINYLDALSDPDNPNNDVKMVANRFLASQSIMLALRGVPGIYFHSLFGSRNWKEGVNETERYRTINREKLDREELEKELADTNSLRSHVYQRFIHMLQVRKTNPSFHPWSEQKLFNVDNSVFALLRTSLDGETKTLCLTNVSNQAIQLKIDQAISEFPKFNLLVDILTETTYPIANKDLKLNIAPYQVLWLQNA